VTSFQNKIRFQLFSFPLQNQLKAGVLKLYLLATPIFVFRNLTTLQDALRPSRFKNITKESLIWELFQKFSISKFGDPFLQIGAGDPQKGRDPSFENRWLKVFVTFYGEK
jgi:hypothetical protein